MSMVQGPTPVVMSGPYANAGPDGEHRSSAYNERLSRARSALTQQRQNKFTNGGAPLARARRVRRGARHSSPAPAVCAAAPHPGAVRATRSAGRALARRLTPPPLARCAGA
eukprot:3269901-Prymnesium_polylepis.1